VDQIRKPEFPRDVLAWELSGLRGIKAVGGAGSAAFVFEAGSFFFSLVCVLRVFTMLGGFNERPA
jgi:hypothetical protein